MDSIGRTAESMFLSRELGSPTRPKKKFTPSRPWIVNGTSLIGNRSLRAKIKRDTNEDSLVSGVASSRHNGVRTREKDARGEYS